MSMANETMNLSEKDDTNFFVRVVRLSLIHISEPTRRS